MTGPNDAALVEERDGLRILVKELEAENLSIRNRVRELRFQLRDAQKAGEAHRTELERVRGLSREPSVMLLGESVVGALLDGLRARIEFLEERLPALVKEAFEEGVCDEQSSRCGWSESYVKRELEELLAPGEEDEEAEDRE